MYRYDWGEAPRARKNLRGSDVLEAFPESRVVWNPKSFGFAGLNTNMPLLYFCLQSSWTKMGDVVLKQMGIAPSGIPKNGLLVEYGSSNNIAWVREDLNLLKAVSLIPNGVGVITLARGNGPLQETLEVMAGSYLAIGVQKHKALVGLQSLFEQEDLWQVSSKAPLPKKERLLEVYANLGIGEELNVVAAVYNEVARRYGVWTDFVAVYRYVVAQLANINFGPKVPLAVVPLEDLLMQGIRLGQVSVSEYFSMLRESLGGDHWWVREVRALNYPCLRCKDWHHISSGGKCQKGRGQQVKKKCKLRQTGQITLAQILEEGAGFSGAGVYMAFGELGNENTIFTLARDYSRGRVYEVLETYLKNETNGLHLIPIGSLYLYAGGSESGVSVDSLVFWEFLARIGSKANAAFSQIWQALPVPFAKRGKETHIMLCMDGSIEITRH